MPMMCAQMPSHHNTIRQTHLPIGLLLSSLTKRRILINSLVSRRILKDSLSNMNTSVPISQLKNLSSQ